MPNTCEWTLTRTVIIRTRNGEGSEKLISKQIFGGKDRADMTRVNEMTAAYSAMKKCYGRASTAEDLITIGDIIVNASDITAVGFRSPLTRSLLGRRNPPATTKTLKPNEERPTKTHRIVGLTIVNKMQNDFIRDLQYDNKIDSSIE